MSFEDQLRSDLGDIRLPEAVAPPADLADTVLTAVRRQARRRALVAAGGLVIAVVVAGGTAPVWLSSQPGTSPAASARPPSGTWESFDPLSSDIDASGVTGYQVSSSAVSTYFQAVEMNNAAGDRVVGVLLYAAGGEPHYFDADKKPVPFDPGAAERAGSVDGAPAYRLPDEDFGNAYNKPQGVAWQWAPGAWAFVFVAEAVPGRDPSATPDPASTVRPEDLRATAAQIAPQLKLGVGKPMTGPFSMPVPDGTRLTTSVRASATEDDGTPYSVFLLGFDTADKPDRTYPPSGDLQPSLLVMADNADYGGWPRDASTMTGYPGDLGYPAYQHEGLLSVYEVAGFAVNIWPLAIPDVDTDAEKVSLAAGIFRTMTIYPGAADNETSWGKPIT